MKKIAALILLAGCAPASYYVDRVQVSIGGKDVVVPVANPQTVSQADRNIGACIRDDFKAGRLIHFGDTCSEKEILVWGRWP
jgi:hypothetical protein